MSFIPYQPNQQEQFIDEYTTSDEEMTEREEMQDSFANLILEEEDFQLFQIKYKSYSHAQIAGFIHSLQEEGCLVPEAAKKASIPRSTAYKMWNEFNESGGKELPGFKKKT